MLCLAAMKASSPNRRLEKPWLRCGAVVLVVLAALSPGCRRLEHPLVVVIPETTAQEIWESEHAGVASVIAGSNWRIYWNGPTREDDISRQIALTEQAESRRADGLILAPDHPLALTTTVRRIVARRIPTVIVGTALQMQPERNLGFVLNDDSAAGALAATEVATELHGAGEVALLGVNPDITSSEDRGAAFARTLAESFPRIHLVAQLPGSFSLGQAEEGAEEILLTHPHLGAMVSIGTTETRAVLIAIHASTSHPTVVLIGFDQDLDLLYALRQGNIQAIIGQNTFAMGSMAMQLIKAARRNESIAVVRRVAPVLITRGTVDSDAVQQMLSTDWRP